jgi:hypothetical protein
MVEMSEEKGFRLPIKGQEPLAAGNVIRQRVPQPCTSNGEGAVIRLFELSGCDCRAGSWKPTEVQDETVRLTGSKVLGCVMNRTPEPPA